MEAPLRSYRVLLATSLAVAALATVLAVLVIIERRDMGILSKNAATRHLTAIEMQRLIATVPNPLVKTSTLGGTIEPVYTRIIGGKTVQVFGIALYEDTDENRSQTMQANAIYFILTPNIADIDTVPMDYAIRSITGTTDGAQVNYYGYKYSDVDASAEKAHRLDTLFASRFPGTFFASAKTLAANASDLTSFQTTNKVTFKRSDLSSGSAHFARNSLYIVVVNETAGAKVVLFPPAVCGDGLKSVLEACDDGNATAGDGCNAQCTVESGYSCTNASPSVCTRNGAGSSASSSTGSGNSSSTSSVVSSVSSSASSVNSASSVSSAASSASSSPSVGSSSSSATGGGGAVCGNSIIEGDEECDMGTQNGAANGTCTTDCKFSNPLPF